MLHQRRAGRVILLDRNNHLLLLQGHDPSLEAEPWWFTPGGGAEEGETLREAALRELFEETGLRLTEVEGPIWLRHASFDFNGDHYEQSEEFYFARIDAHDVDTSGWSALENQSVLSTRWWPIDELSQASQEVFPPGLAVLVSDLISHGPPATPFELPSQLR